MTRRIQSRALFSAALFVLSQGATPAHAVLAHRYSFTADASDSVAGPSWTVNGGATFSGGQVVLDGVDDFLSLASTPLPTAVGSSATIEVWGTYSATSAVGSRIFDFSNVGISYLYLTPIATPGTPTTAPVAASNTRLRYDDGLGEIGPMVAGTSTTGQQVLLTAVVDFNASLISLYRDGGLVATAPTGGLDLLGTLGGVSTSHRLGSGESIPTGGDLPAFLSGSLSEVRIYDNVQSANQILSNAIAGPDATVSLTDKTWNAAASTWNTGANWTPAGVPAGTHRAVIGNAGTATVSGATPTVGAVQINNGTLTVDAGATLQATYPIELTPGDTNTATVNVNSGGRLIVSGITNDGLTGAKALNVDGGAVQAGFASAIVQVGVTTNVGAGGMTLDTQANAMSWDSALSGAGAVTKTGSGRLNIRGGTTATGNLRVDQNPLFTGEFHINEGTVDIGQHTGVFGRGGSAGWGKVTMTNSTLLHVTQAPGNGSVLGADLHIIGDNVMDNLSPVVRPIGLEGSISGSGTLRFRKSGVAAAEGVDFQNGAADPDVTNAGFTGRIVLEGNIAVRIRAAASDFPNAIFELANPGSWLGKRGPDVNQTIQLGGVAGVVGSHLDSSIAGAGDVAADVTYELGGVPQDVEFFGDIRDSNATDFVAVVKVGANTQALSGPNTYSGTTTVNGGKLLINSTHQQSATLLLPVGDYTVNTGGTLGGTGVIGVAADTIDVAVNGGTLAPGASVGTLSVEGNVAFDASSHFQVEVQGSTADKLVANALNIAGGATLDVTTLGSVAAGARVIAEYDVGMLTGTFTLNAPTGYSVNYATPGQVILNVPASAIPGDFDLNGVVNGLDLAKWRTDFGGPGSDADSDGDSDGADFLVWQRNLGLPAVAAAHAVPEPGAWMLAAIILPALVATRQRGTA